MKSSEVHAVPNMGSLIDVLQPDNIIDADLNFAYQHVLNQLDDTTSSVGVSAEKIIANMKYFEYKLASRLAENPLLETLNEVVKTDDLQHDTLSRSILGIMNSTMLRPSGHSGLVNLRSRTLHGPFKPSACDWSEYYFSKVASKPDVSPSTTIFYDLDQKPVFLRKGFGQPLGVALQDVDVNNIRFIAGSIFAVLADGEEFVEVNGENGLAFIGIMSQRTPEKDEYIGTAKVLPLAQVAAAEFKRLSDFAYTPTERCSGLYYSPGEELVAKKPGAAQLIGKTSLESIRQHLEEVLQKG